jgi:hypothetical protein
MDSGLAKLIQPATVDMAIPGNVAEITWYTVIEPCVGNAQPVALARAFRDYTMKNLYRAMCRVVAGYTKTQCTIVWQGSCTGTVGSVGNVHPVVMMEGVGNVSPLPERVP